MFGYLVLALKDKLLIFSIDEAFNSMLSHYLGGRIQIDLEAASSGGRKLEELQKLIASSSCDLTR